MTFISIIKKNFIYNFKKYIFFYFVNVVIVAMLFIYGNLLYNPLIMLELKESSLYEVMRVSLLGIVIFSLVFITYTNISFLKSRGKEFGVYLTLGMTWKDLTNVILIENIGILIISLLTGLVSGTLFSRLFYMLLNKILISNKIKYQITLKGLLVSIGIFSIIFLCNVMFNLIYIKKISIINAIKSSSNKEVGKKRAVIGLVSIIAFLILAYMIPKVLLGEIFKGKTYMAAVFVILLILSLYIIIGSVIILVKEILSNFPRTYNNNILTLSNLSHRFLAYKNIIYMVSLLIMGAVFFIGLTYSMYSTSRKYVDRQNPYDILFVESDKLNKVSKEEVQNIIKQNGGLVKDYKQLEYIELNELREEEGKVFLWSNRESVISQSNYNKHMNKNYKLKENEALYVVVNKEKINFQHPKAILTSSKDNKLAKEFSGYEFDMPKEKAYKLLEDVNYVSIEKENIVEISEKYTNEVYNGQISLGNTLVVNDNIYNKLKGLVTTDRIKKINLINLNNSQNANNVFIYLVDYLRNANGLDKVYWEKPNFKANYSDEDDAKKKAFRPIYKEEVFKMQIENNGINFFCMIFIGIMFIMANGIVLYYKVLNDIEEEKERFKSLNRIGITPDEVNKNISREMLIIFITPVIIGSALGLYLIYVMYSNLLTDLIKSIIYSSSIVIVIIMISQLVFYLIAKRKYFNEIN